MVGGREEGREEEKGMKIRGCIGRGRGGAWGVLSFPNVRVGGWGGDSEREVGVWSSPKVPPSVCVISGKGGGVWCGGGEEREEEDAGPAPLHVSCPSAGVSLALEASPSVSRLEILSSSAWTSLRPNLDPDLRTVPGVLLPPPGVPGPPAPAFLVSRLLKKLASTPSLV